MKLAWLTDIHINFIDDDEIKKFYQDIIKTHCDAVLISGDIAEAPCLVNVLTAMADQIKMPIYFILGNHDYYNGNIEDVREAMKSLTKRHGHLFWLPASGNKALDGETILLGQDGWADGRIGDYQNSLVEMNDSRFIEDLSRENEIGRSQLLKKMQQLADTDAVQLQNHMDQAISQHPKKIIVLTHVPPFKQACFHDGQISDDNWLPFFTSKATGDVLLRNAQENPGIEFEVLCGHTHTQALYQPLENLTIHVGRAQYRVPELQAIIGLSLQGQVKFTFFNQLTPEINLKKDSIGYKR